jgi:hypothetical protein
MLTCSSRLCCCVLRRPISVFILNARATIYCTNGERQDLIFSFTTQDRIVKDRRQDDRHCTLHVSTIQQGKAIGIARETQDTLQVHSKIKGNRQEQHGSCACIQDASFANLTTNQRLRTTWKQTTGSPRLLGVDYLRFETECGTPGFELKPYYSVQD